MTTHFITTPTIPQGLTSGVMLLRGAVLRLGNQIWYPCTTPVPAAIKTEKTSENHASHLTLPRGGLQVYRKLCWVLRRYLTRTCAAERTKEETKTLNRGKSETRNPKAGRRTGSAIRRHQRAASQRSSADREQVYQNKITEKKEPR